MQKIKLVFQKSFGFSLLSLLVSLPNLYYLKNYVYFDAPINRYPDNISFINQGITLFILLFICCFCGFFYAQFLKLPGFLDKDRKKLTSNEIIIFLNLILLTFLLLDIPFGEKYPEIYPKSILWATSYPFRICFLNEVIFRFGLLTVLIGGFRYLLSKESVNLIVSVFYAIVSTGKFYQNMDEAFAWDYFGSTYLIGNFVVSYFFGYIYIKYGLVKAIIFHFLFGCKILMYSIVY